MTFHCIACAFHPCQERPTIVYKDQSGCVELNIYGAVSILRTYELLRMRDCEWFLGAMDLEMWVVVILDLLS